MSKSGEMLQMGEFAAGTGGPEPAGLGNDLGPEASTGGTGDLNPFPTDPEMITEFITESREHLSTIEDHILTIERNPSDTDSINAVFRGFHTIKGLAGFLDQKPVQEVAHQVETLLDLVRSGKLTISPNIADAIFASTDFLHSELDRLEQLSQGEPAEPPGDYADLLLRVALASRPEENLLAPLQLAPEPASPHPAIPPVNDIRPDLFPAKDEPRNPDAAPIRIEASKLENLMNMVGELVIAQTMVSQSSERAGGHDSRLTADLSLLARITADVLRVATGMRMVPIGIQFQKTSRLVRDLSRQFGKEVTLITHGDDMEIDRTIAEQLSDPLLHMVRNSIDHGIEPPERRRLSGKSPMAHVTLSARLHAGQTVIQISDDGRGLDRAKILAKAAERGVIGAIPPASDAEVFALIFAPGFSTAEKVTGISGRGVGMDVVRSSVEKMRGTVEIASIPNQGTTFTVRLPLTLAMLHGLVVSVGSGRYILPSTSVIQTARFDAIDLLPTATGDLGVARGESPRIIRLHEHFRLSPRSLDLADGVLILCMSGGSKFCLFVDEVIGTQEVAVQSLGETFRHAIGLAGCAVLADGCIGLILDLDGIFKTGS